MVKGTYAAFDAGRSHGIERPDRPSTVLPLPDPATTSSGLCAAGFNPVSPQFVGIQSVNTFDARGLEGADAVVHLAGAGVGDRHWSEDRKRILVESRTRSTALLVGALTGLEDPPRVLVSASAIGYYGDRRDEVLTEQSPPGDDFLASLCVRWEDEAPAAPESGIRVVCARTGLVLSPEGGRAPSRCRCSNSVWVGISAPAPSGGVGSPSMTRSELLRGSWRMTCGDR